MALNEQGVCVVENPAGSRNDAATLRSVILYPSTPLTTTNTSTAGVPYCSNALASIISLSTLSVTDKEQLHDKAKAISNANGAPSPLRKQAR